MKNKLSPEHHKEAVAAAKVLIDKGLETKEYVPAVNANDNKGDGGTKELREIVQDKPLENSPVDVKPSYAPDVRAKNKDKSKGIEP